MTKIATAWDTSEKGGDRHKLEKYSVWGNRYCLQPFRVIRQIYIAPPFRTDDSNSLLTIILSDQF